jgi:hypothetical protein
VLARLAEEKGAGSPPLLLHVARDDRRLEALADGLAFFAPKVRLIQFPAWDTVPYDRIGPNTEIVATRVAAMARLAATARKGAAVVLTTVNAILQRLPPREFIRRSLKTIAPGQRIDMGVQRPQPGGLPAHRHRHSGRMPCAAAYSICSRRDGWPRAPRFLRRHAGARQSFDPGAARARSCRS